MAMCHMAHPSPNQGPRRNGARPDLIVIHYTAMDNTEAVLRWLCTPEREVSAHYVICPKGRIYQLVDEAERAWHAGAGAWGSCTDVNSHSIGIELVNSGQTPFSAPQMNALEGLMHEMVARHSILPERVIAHSDLAPGRKSDPGARFDWRRLAHGGFGVWPRPALPPARPDAEAFLRAARRFGYTAKAPPEAILAAFRLRFRPGANGPVSADDLAAIRDLARRFPVDRRPLRP